MDSLSKKDESKLDAFTSLLAIDSLKLLCKDVLYDNA